MGFHHEQSRSDRDDYVTILMDNVESGKEHNFDKEADNNYGIQYDYSSNMHYGMDVSLFSNHKNVMMFILKLHYFYFCTILWTYPPTILAYVFCFNLLSFALFDRKNII